MKRQCLDEETILDFLGNRLAASVRERIETHLCVCAECRERLSLAAELIHGDGDEDVAAPEAVTQRTVDAVNALSECGPGWRQRLKGWGARIFPPKDENAVEAPFGAGQYAMALRGVDEGSGIIVNARIEGPGFAAVMEAEAIADAHFTIRLIPDPEEIAETPLRVGLFTGELELASMTFRDEIIEFEEIPSGDYTLAFSRSARQLATFPLPLSSG